MSPYDLERNQYLRFLDSTETGRSGQEESIRTTPLFSLAVKHIIDKTDEPESSSSDDGFIDSDESEESSDAAEQRVNLRAKTKTTSILPQYGLLGFHVGDHEDIDDHEPIMLNINAPNSAFICGSQGSGKSYTLSCMLENCLLADQQTGRVQNPVAGVVFHYDVDASGSVAEAAHLCSRGIKVNVLVSNSNAFPLRRAYEAIPGALENLTVRPLLLAPSDLSIDRMHKLMAFSEKAGTVPLYMECIQRILREMAITGQGGPFNYAEFKNKLASEGLSRDQNSMMALRLGLLESFMIPITPNPPGQKKKRTATSVLNLLALTPGTLTIIDLSDPFIDAATVCVLFDICLSLIKEKRPRCGLVLALDEAHKYMEKTSSAANNFTDRLLTTVREQRHNATRVFIATQEPTISERLLDLCSVTIVHRFTSPAWFVALRDHLGGASKLMVDHLEEMGEETKGKAGKGKGQARGAELFEQIVALGVGESLVFSPGAYVSIDKRGHPKPLVSGVLKMKTRIRAGADGGRSILAGPTDEDAIPVQVDFSKLHLGQK